MQAAHVVQQNPYSPAKNGALLQQGYVRGMQAACVVQQKEFYDPAENEALLHDPEAQAACVVQQRGPYSPSEALL